MIRQFLKRGFAPVALLIATCTVGVVSCSSDGCQQNQSAVPLAAFKSYQTGEGIGLDSIEIRGIGAPNDSVLVPVSRTPIVQVYLPMRPTAESVTWEIAYMRHAYEIQGLKDEISIDYISEPYFASEECGAFYRYRITSLTHTSVMIDSVAVTDSLVSNIDKTYIEIFFRTANDDEGGDEPAWKGGRR